MNQNCLSAPEITYNVLRFKNLINSISLILLGVWGYIDGSSITALIPTAFGAILLACAGGVKNQNKIIAHIAVLLTLLILFALLGMRLPKSLESGGIGLFRVLFMCGTSLLAMIYFVKIGKVCHLMKN